MVKVVVSLSLSPRNLGRKNRKEGWKRDGGSRANEPREEEGEGPFFGLKRAVTAVTLGV